MMRITFLLIFLCTYALHAEKCHGRFVNPITDICWSCIFPITIGGIRVSASGEDTPNASAPVCICGTPVPRIGIPISFWEPVRLMDVTRIPYCLVNMGGLHIMNRGVKGHGGVENSHQHSQHARVRKSFYHVHWYVYPIMYWLSILTDFVCMEADDFSVGYISELDPTWNDDETAFILNPEAVLFANPVAQAACTADCVAASAGFPLDMLFWCAGCQGSIYPFSGTVPYHINGTQASALLVQRVIAKLHRMGMLWGTVGEDALCDKYPMPIIKKSQYKTQILFPIPATKPRDCHPLGRSDVVWGAGKEIPFKGEDFGYLIWRKRSCCLL